MGEVDVFAVEGFAGLALPFLETEDGVVAGFLEGAAVFEDVEDGDAVVARAEGEVGVGGEEVAEVELVGAGFGGGVEEGAGGRGAVRGAGAGGLAGAGHWAGEGVLDEEKLG